jgi:hypothetical protein
LGDAHAVDHSYRLGMLTTMLAEFTRVNVVSGRELGAGNDDANVYAPHNLGSGDGPRFLNPMAKFSQLFLNAGSLFKIFVDSSHKSLNFF